VSPPNNIFHIFGKFKHDEKYIFIGQAVKKLGSDNKEESLYDYSM